MNNFLIIWQYKVIKGKNGEFEKLYGENGDWIKLFKRFPDYIKTELFKNLSDNSVYITIDFWKSKESYIKFKDETVDEFLKFDKAGEELTIEEKKIIEYFQT